MEFPGDPASLSNSTIPGPSLALLRRETVAWFTFSLRWPRRRMFNLFPTKHNVVHQWLQLLIILSLLHLRSTLWKSATAGFESTTTDRNWWYFVTLSWSLFPVLSPQCRGFLLDGQRQSSKLSLIPDRHDKSQVVRSIAAVRQRKDATKLVVFFRFFHAFPATCQWQTACKSDLRVLIQLRSAFSKNQENGAGKQWSLHAPSKNRSQNF